MYIYDEMYYSDDYLKTLNDTERTIMFKGSFVAQMGMLYEEVVEYIRKDKLIIKVNQLLVMIVYVRFIVLGTEIQQRLAFKIDVLRGESGGWKQEV